MNWGWSEILWVSLIGFSLVFILLVALIFIMKAFGACFRVRPASGKKVDAQPMISEEEIAAIATALKIYRGALHDRADHSQHQAGLFALEFENSRFNPASRPEIGPCVGTRQPKKENERLLFENQRT